MDLGHRRNSNNKIEPGAIREAIEVGRHTGRAQTDYHEQMDGAPVTASEFREQLSRVVPLRGKGEKTRADRFIEWWVIDPRKTKWIGYWDMATVVALLFVALVTPFEVAFLDSPRDWNDVARRFGSVGWLFTVNRCVDGLFIVDLVLQFRLMYTEVDSAFGTQWVTNPTRIIRHYLKTWFALDVLRYVSVTIRIVYVYVSW